MLDDTSTYMKKPEFPKIIIALKQVIYYRVHQPILPKQVVTEGKIISPFNEIKAGAESAGAPR